MKIIFGLIVVLFYFAGVGVILVFVVSFVKRSFSCVFFKVKGEGVEYLIFEFCFGLVFLFYGFFFFWVEFEFRVLGRRLG